MQTQIKVLKKSKNNEPKPSTSKMSENEIQDQQPSEPNDGQRGGGGGATGSVGGGKVLVWVYPQVDG